MIRGASLLKDGGGSSAPEVDELRAEMIKQKILFEAELRRQREISDERFASVARQLQAVLDDNAQLRHTLHALGERLSLVEHRGRSASPAPPQQQVQQQLADGTTVSLPAAQRHGVSRPLLGGNNSSNSYIHSGVNQSGISSANLRRQGSTGSRQTSPVPRVAIPQPVPQQYQQHQQAHFIKIRSSPATTPRTTPRAPITRTASAVSVGSTAGAGGPGGVVVGATSPAHIPFRPVLRSQPFRSPLRPQQLAQLGKSTVATGQWR